MPRLTDEEKAVLAILKAVSDINLDPGYTAMYLEQSLGPAKRVLDEVLYLAGYRKIGEEYEDENPVENQLTVSSSEWGLPDSINKDGSTTDFALKAEILSEVWLNARDVTVLSDLFEYSDLGFPIAYAYFNSMIQINESSANLIVETFNLLLAATGQMSDRIYESLEDFNEEFNDWLEGVAESEEHSEEGDEYDSDIALIEYQNKHKAEGNSE